MILDGGPEAIVAYYIDPKESSGPNIGQDCFLVLQFSLLRYLISFGIQSSHAMMLVDTLAC